MKKVKSTSLFLGVASAMAFAQDGAACIPFVNGTGHYGEHCYNAGLKDMEKGKCYTMNPDRKSENPQWINDIVSQTWWWVETACVEAPASSSSVEVSSSSVAPASSSSEVASSSSEEPASSSSEVASSSSEEPASSSSEVVSSSSAEPVSSSSEIIVASKCVEFVNGSGNYNGKCFNSGLNDMTAGKCYKLNPDRGEVRDLWINNRAVDSWWWVETSCGAEPESSSSSEEVSSSSEEVSSSSEEVSSSSEEVSSSSEEVSSSSEEVSSSSEEVSSSSEEVSSSSEEVSSSSEEVSSSSEEVSSSSEEVSSSSEEVSSSSETPVELCIDFGSVQHRIGQYCYKSGLKNMVKGTCYVVVESKRGESSSRIRRHTDVTDKSWWIETPCFAEVSSSSEEVSSSSEEVSSSSEEVSSSSEEVSSSSEDVSSSSEEVSSSSEEVSSSSEDVSSSSEEVSSSSEEVSSSSEELSSSSEEVSSSSEEVSSSSEVVVSKCVTFVNGSGDYNGKCFNAGLNDMTEGKCYMLNPDRGEVRDLWINNRAVDSWWWVETSCGDEPESSSSVEESSSSEEVSSSSEEVSSSSEEVSSSSEEVSSSSEEVSSSSEEVSSSSEEVSSSSEEVSSSSEDVSSSSEEVSSSSEASSSSVESSSSEVVVSKCVEFVNGSGDYNGKCFNAGLNDMTAGKCYKLNPDRGEVREKWINNRAVDSWWWVETSCFDEPEVILVKDPNVKPAPKTEDPILKSNGRDNGTTSIAAAVEAKSNIAFVNNTLSIASTSNGAKTVKVFSVRGDVLLSKTFSGASMSLDMSKFAGKGAVIVRLAEGRKVLATKRIAVR